MAKRVWVRIIPLCFLLAVISMSTLSAAKTFVYDEYGVFSGEELVEINQEIAEINERTGIDFAVIYLSGVPAGSSSKYYHEMNKQFLQNHDFGQGTEKTAVAMSVDMENRHIQVTAHGKMYETYKQDKHIQATIKAVGVKLRADDFKGAVHTFVDYSLSAYEETNRSIFVKIIVKMFTFWPMLGSFVIALIVAGVFALAHNQNPKIQGYNYEKLNSFRVNHRIDRFLYTTTTTRTISDSDDSSGGGGFSNDSDSSYSGGGGSF